MKIIRILFIWICLLSTFQSCDKLLDFKPIDQFGNSNFWTERAQVEGYIVGIHSLIRDKAWNLYKFGEERGGWQKYGGSSSNTTLNDFQIKTQALTEQNANTSNWDDFYEPIMAVNELIYQVTKVPFLNESDRNYYLGQAYGMRAFLYFHLYRTYGGVPVVTEPKVIQGVNNPNELYVARSTPAVTLEFIKSDIDRSVEMFENDNFTMKGSRTIWNKGASLMLRGEVYLWSAKVSTGDYTADKSDLLVAEESINAILNNENYALQPYDKLFLFENKGNNEMIWSISYDENEKSNFYNTFTYNNAFENLYYGRDGEKLIDPLDLRNSGVQRHEYTYELFSLFDEEDIRRETTFFDFYNTPNPDEATIKGVIFRKFLGMINSGGNRLFVDNIPVYRLADAILLKAEIANAKGEDPSPYINQIRQRAYSSGSYPAYSAQSKEENEYAIYIERLKEFVGEGKSWYDARRMYGVGEKPLVYKLGLLKEETESHKLLWPIDINVLSNDPLVKQTPGYSGT